MPPPSPYLDSADLGAPAALAPLVRMRPNLLIASFMYHEVTDDPETSGFQRPRAKSYTLSRRAFAAHLDRFENAPVAPSSVLDIDFNQAARHVLLTFDDGGKSALHSSEELLRRGWIGHFFIVTSFIGRPNFINEAEIRHLQSCGHVVGSHSHTHPNILREQPLRRVSEEWRVSRDILSNILGEPCVVASIPGGHMSRRILQCSVHSGFTHLFTSEPWLSPRALAGCRLLGRYSVRAGTSAARIDHLARFNGWRRALVTRNLKVAAQMVLPRLYRRYDAWMTREKPPAPNGAASADTPHAP